MAATANPGMTSSFDTSVLFEVEVEGMTSRPIRSPQIAREHRVRPEEILDAATDLFAEFGYFDAATSDLVEKLGIGKGTIYLHWRTKLELFEALILRESIEVVEEIIAMLRRKNRGNKEEAGKLKK